MTGRQRQATMKRKRSPEPTTLAARKKALQRRTDLGPALSPLVHMLQQYGLLEMVLSSLFPDDLLSLLLSSRAIHNAILPRVDSLENLLGKLCCSGKGVAIRNLIHKKSTFFTAYNCIEYVRCGTDTLDRKVESGPCTKCKVTTCNECRIHCVYQSIFETPTATDELPNFSGFVFLGPAEVPISSPRHVPEGDSSLPEWKNPVTSHAGPYHDQGFIDVALDEDATAPLECVEELLDLDLGSNSLLSYSAPSHYLFPSPVLRPFNEIVDKRKLFLCWSCFADASKGPEALEPTLSKFPWLPAPFPAGPIKPCKCTLRNRFLDRWLCLPCYEEEDEMIRYSVRGNSIKWHGRCPCGLNAHHALCLWCWGEIHEPKDDSEVPTDGDGSSSESTPVSPSEDTSSS